MELKITYIDPRKLKPYPGNNVKHPESQILELVAAINEFGFTKPVGVDADLVLIYGHGATEAAIRAGLSHVPTVDLSYLSERQKRAYRIADNKIARNSIFDFEAIASEVQALIDADFDIDLLGFNEQELDAILQNNESILPTDWGLDSPAVYVPPAQREVPEMAKDPDEYEEPEQIQIDVQPGDVIEIGVHRLMCGDSTNAKDVDRLLDGNCPFLLVTDPPYGVEYDPDWRNHTKRSDGTNIGAFAIGKVSSDDQHDWTLAYKLAPCVVAYVWHAAWYTDVCKKNLEHTGFQIRAQIIWAKNNFAISRGHYHWQHEPCWYAFKPGQSSKFIADRSQTTLWKIDKPMKSESGHSTQKPIECMARPIRNHEGDVYDPFIGSGTTMIAAHELNRKCYGMEISPRYCQVIINRMLATFPGIQVKINGIPYYGQTEN